MEFKEITAKTVDEAITKACLEFETSSDNLEIQVVQEGTSGFLGFIGSKPAVIKVRKKVKEEEFDILKELAKEEKKEKKAPVKEEKKEPKKEIKKETKPVKEPKKGTVTKTQTENKEEKPVAKEAQPKPEAEKTGCPYRRTGTADETGCRKISDRRIWCNGTSGGDYHEL